MEIVALNGTDSRLYQLVAPLVMNVDAIKYNNGYPFNTDDTYVWHLALDSEGRVLGFMPVTVIDKDISNRMASTIRHNRARGTHSVELMSNIVAELCRSDM